MGVCKFEQAIRGTRRFSPSKLQPLPQTLKRDMSMLQSDTAMADMTVDVNGERLNGSIMDGLNGIHTDMQMDLTGDPQDQVFNSIESASSRLHEIDPKENHINGANGTTAAGPGAGPLPTGFGVSANAGANNAGSTLTEFTKRRNWSQRVLEELKDFLYILTPDGRLLYVSPSTKSLTGYKSSDLVGKFIVDFIHNDDSSIFLREFNESIATGNPLRFFYRFKKSDGTYTIFESHGHPHLTSEAAAFGLANAAGFCRGFFMMARPYPTRNAGLLDSFLEHKIENERIQRRIAELRREEAEEAEAQRRHLERKAAGHESVTPSESTGGMTAGTPPPRRSASTERVLGVSASHSGMPPPAKPGVGAIALTQQNLDEKNALSRPDSITDKMARYEGATHLEGIEMLTGLHYRDGERSQGISTGDTSPALIRGDAGIAIPLDKDRASSSGAIGMGDKKKKLKAADEYVCTDCGTLDSPEWRKGPNGPKTLCNACGLRWAKKEKKRTTTGGPGSGTQGTPGLQQASSRIGSGSS